MKILAIRLKNLASLEGVFEIDFNKEPLKSAGIYAITGPTGAGKSTLLDAICLALFAKTPRQDKARESGIELQDGINNKISQGDIRSILRKGSTDGYAEVEFIGIDGCPYKSVWSVRRARNRADGSLQSDSIVLTKLDTNTVFPEKKLETINEITRLVGLNYGQFTRSVLLAQGDFTTFLIANKDDKSALLEKLTGTDIYSEISKCIYEKTKQAEQELNSLRKQMEGITLLTDEELLLLNEQKGILEKKVHDLKVESDKIVSEINWYTVLHNLVLDKDKAEAAWNLSGKEKEDAAERIKKLAMVESVQGAKNLFESRENVRKLQQQKSVEASNLALRMKELEEKVHIANISLTQAQALFSQKESDYKNALPDIDKAKKTDTLIAEKKDQIGLATTENEAAKAKQKDHLTLLLSKEIEITALAKEIEELTTWKNNNISNQKIAENIALILSKLTDADKFVAQQKNILTETEQVKVKIKKSGDDIEALEKSIDIKAKALEALSASFQLQTKQLEAIPIATIKDTLTQFSKSLENTVISKGCWEMLFASQQEYDKIQTRITNIKETLSSKTEELGLVNHDLQTAFIKKEQTEKLLLKAKLETAENVELMRSQLIEGEPCPVCGSEHHAYTKDTRTLHSILDGLILESKTCVEQYEELLKTQSSLGQLCKSLEKEQSTTEAEVVSISESITIRDQKWQACNPNKKCLELPDHERLAWFETEISDIKTNIIDIQNQIDNYDQLKTATGQKKIDLEKCTNELSLNQQSRKDIQRDKETSSADLTRLENELNACKTSISDITNTLAPNFNNPGWKDNWEKDPVVFKERLKSFAGEWDTKIKLLEANTNKQGVLNTEFKGLKKQMESFEASVKTTEAKLADLLGNHHLLLDERKKLFNGDEISVVEKRFQKAIDDAQTALALCKSGKDTIDGEINKTKGNIEQLNHVISSFNQKLEEHSLQIREWLSNYNTKKLNQVTEEIVIPLLEYTPEWISAERTFISNLEQTLTRTKATFEERKLKWEAHLQKKLSDRTLEELQTSQVEVNENINSSSSEKNEIEFRLRQDAENKKQVSSLLSEINTRQSSFTNWQKLNELIGSSDGKKFRQIAQEYTLDILLGYANIHLQLLAKRYKLARILDTLALQVMDKDMGDEIRSVHSLSGGESFLVSLALALALASLSTNKMKVESLFIDEGFGSLDPATLNIAMDALECLHNQGRKVGVISHVQEMTERIPTQIKVSKLSNGKSKLEVLGAIV